MALISLSLLFIIFVILLVFGLRKWLLNYIKILKAYGSIPSPPNKLPIIGNLLSLPLDPYGEK